MRITRRRAATAAAAVSLAAAAVPATASAKPVITMSGSTSVAPLAAQLAKAYVKSCRHCVSFKLLQGGSNVGIADIGRGRGGVSIGNSSRDPKPGDPGGIVFNKIALDAICLITNKANTLPDLDQKGVQAIFGSRVRDWSQVPGATIQGTIDLFGRPATSGTHDAFQKIFLDPVKAPVPPLVEKGANGLVQEAVVNGRNAIGYVSLHFDAGAHPVSYNGKACDLRNAKSGQYDGVRSFYMVTRGPASGAVGKWIKWIQDKRNKVSQGIIASSWVPLP